MKIKKYKRKKDQLYYYQFVSQIDQKIIYKSLQGYSSKKRRNQLLKQLLIDFKNPNHSFLIDKNKIQLVNSIGYILFESKKLPKKAVGFYFSELINSVHFEDTVNYSSFQHEYAKHKKKKKLKKEKKLSTQPKIQKNQLRVLPPSIPANPQEKPVQEITNESIATSVNRFPSPPIIKQSTPAKKSNVSKYWLIIIPLIFTLTYLAGCFNKKESRHHNSEFDSTVKITQESTSDRFLDTLSTQSTDTVLIEKNTCTCKSKSSLFTFKSDILKEVLDLDYKSQFGDIISSNRTDIKHELEQLSRLDSGNRLFIDHLLAQQGYLDINTLPVDSLSLVYIPGGTVGILGYNKNHGIDYALLSPKGVKVEAIKIHSTNGCNAYITKKGGHYFYFCDSF